MRSKGLIVIIALGLLLLGASGVAVHHGVQAAAREAVGPQTTTGTLAAEPTFVFEVTPSATVTRPTPIVISTLTPRPTATPVSTPSPTPPLASNPPPASGPPTRIIIPKIKVDARVIPVGWKIVERDGKRVSEWETADYAVGWHKTSAYPGGGGNIVLSGHNNIKGEVFRDLVNVESGDKVTLYVGETEYPYVVTEAFLLRETGVSEEQQRQNTQWIMPTADERVTLVSCWPYWSNTHRVIVIAKPAR